jgi:hypothetical protein
MKQETMKKIALALCSALMFTLPSVHAQSAAPVDPATSAAIKELLVSMNYRELMKSSFAQLEKNMPAIMLQGATASINGNPRLSDADKKAAIEKATKEIPAVSAVFGETLQDPKLMDELFAEMTPLYARHFTAAEIKQMSAFYKTPVGKKMLSTMPQIMSESMQISQRVMMPRIGAAIEKLTPPAQPAPAAVPAAPAPQAAPVKPATPAAPAPQAAPVKPATPAAPVK